MKSLMAKNSNEFPWKSSLFWTNNGNIDSTWPYLARNCDDARQQRMINWQVANGMNTMIFLTYARGGDCVVNPFIQTYGPDVDLAEWVKWQPRLELGKIPGINFIPCLFCDDDPETAQNVAFHNFYVPGACIALYPYYRVICAGLEMSEQFNLKLKTLGVSAREELHENFRVSMESIIQICQRNTDKPITVHMQWDRKRKLPKGITGLIFEHPWHPSEGDKHSADEVASIGMDVINKAEMPVGFNEYNRNVKGQRIREQTEALKKLPNCFMVGGPIQK